MRFLATTAVVLLSSSFSVAQNVSFVEQVGNSSHVFLANLADGDIAQLTSGPDTDQSPEWSFNGQELTFQRNGSDVGGYVVMVMNSNGTGLKDISGSSRADILPSWTPTGQIVFSQVIQPPSPATMNAPVTALMIMNANGSDRRALVTPSPTSMFNLAAFASPNGTKIVFECGPAFNAPMQIWEINSNGTGFKYLTETQGAASADPHWSADGAKIIFDSTRAGGVNLFSMNADGSDVTQLTSFSEPLEAQDAGYSQNGNLVVFEWDDGGDYSSNAAAPAALWMMDSNGADQHALGIACAESGCAPRFQPGPMSEIAGAFPFNAMSGMAGGVPEPPIWAAILLGFAGLALTGCRRERTARGSIDSGRRAHDVLDR